MLKRYAVDVTALTAEEINALIKEFEKCAYECFVYPEKHTIDVYIDSKYNFEDLFTVDCPVYQM